MNIVILKTDALFFILITAVFLYTVYARRREHLLVPWRQVSRQPMGMSAVVVLSLYVMVAFLDSIHFHPRLDPSTNNDSSIQYSVELTSVFDLVVAPMKRSVEKTYSAPLATHAFAKETMRLPDGSTYRGYRRLTYGGAHLEDPANDRAVDLLSKGVRGCALGLLVWLLVVVSSVACRAARYGEPFRDFVANVLAGETVTPWRAIFGTLAVCAVVIGF